MRGVGGVGVLGIEAREVTGLSHIDLVGLPIAAFEDRRFSSSFFFFFSLSFRLMP